MVGIELTIDLFAMCGIEGIVVLVGIGHRYGLYFEKGLIIGL